MRPSNILLILRISSFRFLSHLDIKLGYFLNNSSQWPLKKKSEPHTASCVILVTAPQLCGRRNLSVSANSSLGLVLQAKIPPVPLPPDTPSLCAVWRQLQWAPDVAWHPSSHGTGYGLKVVWKHHPPADPMKVPQTIARVFCPGFTFVQPVGAHYLNCGCLLYVHVLLIEHAQNTEGKWKVFPSVSVEISTSFIHPRLPSFVPFAYEFWFKKYYYVFCWRKVIPLRRIKAKYC